MDAEMHVKHEQTHYLMNDSYYGSTVKFKIRIQPMSASEMARNPAPAPSFVKSMLQDPQAGFC
jgi:hypothetical protein